MIPLLHCAPCDSGQPCASPFLLRGEDHPIGQNCQLHRKIGVTKSLCPTATCSSSCFFPIYTGAIKSKTEALGAMFPGGSSPFGLIEVKCNQTCRSGGGPLYSGQDAAREDQAIQSACYNGWLRYHGFKNESQDAFKSTCRISSPLGPYGHVLPDTTTCSPSREAT